MRVSEVIAVTMLQGQLLEFLLGHRSVPLLPDGAEGFEFDRCEFLNGVVASLDDHFKEVGLMEG